MAAGIARFGLAADTGGSVRIPAAFCGIYGFRPSPTRYPHTGMLPISPTRDTIGLMACCVEDIQLVDQVIVSGRDQGPVVDINDLKIGVPTEFFCEKLSPGISDVLESALATIEAAGVSLVEYRVDQVAKLDEAAGFPIALFEARREWEAFLAEKELGFMDDLRAGLASPDVADVFTAMIDEAPIPKVVYDDAVTNLRQSCRCHFRRPLTRRSSKVKTWMRSYSRPY